MKHTPAPWLLSDLKTFVRTESGGNIAHIIQNGSQHEANAKLIAAAPDLLEALNACWNLFDAEYEDLSHQGNRVRKQVMEAIQKATE